MFRYIKEKVWGRMQSWKGRTLARSGKEVLIKSVIQAIPTYAASVFLLPQKLCDELENIMNKFWWLSNLERRNGIRWMSWNHMCYPKSMGGMGFRRIREFNIAMLGKQAWRVMMEPQSFIAKLLKARYFPSASFREADLGNNPSYVCRSILAAKDLILKGSLLKVGTGETINVWTDPWIPDANNTRITTPVIQGLEEITVNNLFSNEGRQWDHDLIRDIFNDYDAKKIISIPLSQSTGEDTWIWLQGEKGCYEVKSGYRFCVMSLINLRIWGQILIGRSFGLWLFLQRLKILFGERFEIVFRL